MSFDPVLFRRKVLGILDTFAAHFGIAAEHHSLLRQQVADGDDIHSRSTYPGHVTTSAFILDGQGKRTLLVHHRSLSRWLQPGGHYEAPDSLAGSALREALEETGADVVLDPWHATTGLPIDIDSHRIPARPAKGEPEHWHHDVRYVMRAAADGRLRPDLDEVEQAAWQPVSALWEIAPRAVARMRMLGLMNA